MLKRLTYQRVFVSDAASQGPTGLCFVRHSDVDSDGEFGNCSEARPAGTAAEVRIAVHSFDARRRFLARSWRYRLAIEAMSS